MMWLLNAILIPSLAHYVFASPYRDDLVDYNLNINVNATTPLEYTSSWPGGAYHASPTNWRALPVYTVLLDKFADGDPSNNDFFKTMFESDYRETRLRYGGDLKGLVARLDYLQGMGVRVIFIAGTPFLNMIWQADSYSPLDFTVLDPHLGTISEWRDAISQIHARGMYIMVDFTVGTMSDLIGFEGYLKTATPFDLNEHTALWKHPDNMPWNFTEYRDFSIINERNASCVFPTFWNANGTVVSSDTFSAAHGCLESDFDHYGDMEAFGDHPDWQRQLAKFSSVQDRLRDWKPSVMAKLTHFSCMAIKALDFDAIRVDKAIQLTVDSLAIWSSSTRRCAYDLGKTNFMVTATLRPSEISAAANATASDNNFLRSRDLGAVDAATFHYPIYRSLLRFLGMDGALALEYDLDTDFPTAWQQMFVHNDLLNLNTGLLDPRHMFGTSNYDLFRWPSLQDGTRKSVLATFITSLVLPGMSLISYGEEQNMYIYDNNAANYLFGRQAMSGTEAWKRHGCYRMGSSAYYNMPFDKAALGCQDDWNALDHFDSTADSRRLFRRFHQLRAAYGALQDGFSLSKLGNWTYYVQLPHSPVGTEIGLRSVSRAGMSGVQTLSGTYNDEVWLLYSNEDVVRTYSFDCTSDQGIFSPYISDTVIRNLLAPYETLSLSASLSSSNNGTGAPRVGCLPSITMEQYGFKAFVPVAQWMPPIPALTRFVPGHDHRIQASPSDENSTTVDISLEFDATMNCDSVTQSISFNISSSGVSGYPAITNVRCGAISNLEASSIPGGSMSAWAWSATLRDFPDGVLTINIDNPLVMGGNATTGAVDHLLLRKGSIENVMVFPRNDYDSSGSFKVSAGQYSFDHKAFGAEKFRYSGNFGRNWTDWKAWEETTIMDGKLFTSPDNFWDGSHVMVQYWSEATLSVAHVIHADAEYDGAPRRVPQFLVRGPFNNWGYDKGVKSLMTQNSDGLWELEISAAWPTHVQLNVWSFDHYYYGDSDGDGVLDRLPPNSIAPNFLNISAPQSPYLAWSLLVDDSTMTWTLEPRGRSHVGAVMYALLSTLPLITGSLAVVVFQWSFYGIRHNQYGAAVKSRNWFPAFGALRGLLVTSFKGICANRSEEPCPHRQDNIGALSLFADNGVRRKVLIATLEYEILDWNIKVRIGGLGVISSLMGTSLPDVDLIWVVPKVGDIHYPAGEPAEPIEVIIFGEPYLIDVETHIVDNITYVIIDSPLFRAQTKASPYPARMDDLSSAIFYSTWNQAIATTIRRSPTIDIYHINDYHGTLAAIYLLPKVIPVCLSLHNAEFQGLWPLRTKAEIKEVCSVFNISMEHCMKYVQFGNTFNLLHAAASFISIHQKSVGVAGVSDKYGKRSLARYPALWILKHVDSLPNPDPDDIAPINEGPQSTSDVKIDQIAEASRPELKRQAQEWAGLELHPDSDLLVFVGRWSKQKGVDLVADAMPSMQV
ncbi:hypothetical protein DXG01_002246 [Tephrocybe rancida]|nr:hypothetical protein DXG01_002246 [Tephrocybe rancida]